jgi:enoyl-CoA hydratase
MAIEHGAGEFAATAEEMHAYGSIHSITTPDQLLDEVDALAATIVAKVPAVVRAMKGAINRSTERDLIGKYRAEASYTYELHMSGAAAEARGAWWNAPPALNQKSGESQ